MEVLNSSFEDFRGKESSVTYVITDPAELHLATLGDKHKALLCDVPNENFNRGGASASGREACLRWPLFFASSLRGASAAKHGQSA